jgi:hypothetical protein
MANYNIQIAWSGKDALSDSDPNKIISGTDFNTEFTAIQTAVNTKAELNGNSGEDFNVNDLTVSGSITLGGTAITSTATELNLLDGVTAVTTTTIGTNATGAKTVSTSAPSSGSDGDVWYRVS